MEMIIPILNVYLLSSTLKVWYTYESHPVPNFCFSLSQRMLTAF